MAKKRTHEEFVAEMAIINPNIEIVGIYTSTQSRIKCRCKIDGYEWNPVAAELLRGKGCSVCAGKRLIPGYNDIVTLAPWMIPYFQGGEDEAKKYTRSSLKKIYPICPNCGRIKDKEISIASIYSNHSIGCICSDGVSYPNKFGFSFLEQLRVNNLISEYSPDWAKPYRYDFYFIYKNKEYILEMDGGLGHGKKLWDHSKDTIGLQLDKKKEEIAQNNGLKVIRIDATYSRSNYIKNNIFKNNDIINLFGDMLSTIDWQKCDDFAQNSLVKEVCKYWETGLYKTSELASVFKVSDVTIRNYLRKGEDLGFCNYHSKIKKVISGAKPLLCNNYYLFSSKISLIKNSKSLFNIKITKDNLKNKDDEFYISNLHIKPITKSELLNLKNNSNFCFIQ